MNSINANIPVVNMPQVTQHMPDMHRAPMIHQAQNAEMARDTFEQQLTIAKEAEAADGKNIDPEARKEDERGGGKKKKKNGQGSNNGKGDEPVPHPPMSKSGRFIDLEA